MASTPVMLTGPAHHLCASIVLISAAAVLHHMIVLMVPRRPGLCTPTAPEDLITCRKPATPCPATWQSDRQLDKAVAPEKETLDPTSGRTAHALSVASTPVILTGRAHQSLLVQIRGEPTVSGTVARRGRDVGTTLHRLLANAVWGPCSSIALHVA